MKTAVILVAVCLLTECVALRTRSDDQEVDPKGAKSVKKPAAGQQGKSVDAPHKKLVAVPDTAKVVKLTVRVPPGYAGLSFRRSMNMTDKDSKTALWGAVVEGRVQPGGAWFKTTDGKYLPMVFQGKPSLIPLPAKAPMSKKVVHPVNKKAAVQTKVVKPVNKTSPGSLNDTAKILKLQVRTPKGFSGLKFRRSMNMTDTDTNTVAWGDVVEGRVQLGREWFKTTGGQYLPMVFQGKPALVPLTVVPPQRKRHRNEYKASSSYRVFHPSNKKLVALNETTKTVKLTVRVPKGYAGLRFRRSKDLADTDTRTVVWGDVVEGRVERGGEWFKTLDGKYLPMKFQDTAALVPLPVKAAKKQKTRSPVHPTKEKSPEAKLQEQRPAPAEAAKPVEKATASAPPADSTW